MADTTDIDCEDAALRKAGEGANAAEIKIWFVGEVLAQFTEDAQGTMNAQVSAVHKYNGGVVHEGDMHAARSFSGVGRRR